MKKKSPHPEWALAHKRKGTELRCINGRYYLYEVKCKWCPIKKKPVKVTGKIVGSITEADGFIESDKARLRRQRTHVDRVQVKEYGVTAAIDTLFGDTVVALKKHFPDIWQHLVCLAYGRLVHLSPLKNMAFHYANSFLSEQFIDINLSAKSLSYFLRELGEERQRIVDFCRSFKVSEDCILFDGTDIFSNSERMTLPKYSKSKFGTFDDMINLMCVFSVKHQSPVYYRLLPGNIKDVSAFKLSLEDCGVRDATVIIDKGFTSANNINALEKNDLKFIIPLQRNSKLLHYDKIKSGDKGQFDGHFKYEERYIWHYNIPVDANKSITVFLDDELRTREQKDIMDRIDNPRLKSKPKYTMDNFINTQHQLGTIAILENTGKPPHVIFADYKTRGNVETMIDTLKNIVHADRTYMQNEKSLEGWMFINLIALKWYYTILNILKKSELNKKYSPKDILMFLAEIKKVKINDQWHNAETTKKDRDILDTLKIHIT